MQEIEDRVHHIDHCFMLDQKNCLIWKKNQDKRDFEQLLESFKRNNGTNRHTHTHTCFWFYFHLMKWCHSNRGHYYSRTVIAEVVRLQTLETLSSFVEAVSEQNWVQFNGQLAIQCEAVLIPVGWNYMMCKTRTTSIQRKALGEIM